MSSYTFTMYRESMHRQTGLGIGDDALPYAGAHLISVADGLGGSAYPAPVDVNPELLNQETSFSAMLGGILDTESESSGTYRRQYEDNFFTDRFDLAKDYVRAGGRKSSYFGSRLTNLLMRRHLEEMFAGEQLDSYFEEMRSATPAQREQRNQQLGETLAEMLGNELRQAAVNGGIVLGDMKISHMSLMGTTYSGILFRENEQDVDTLTIQAGDSLPYVLSLEQENGGGRLRLKLLQQAQEKENGEMFNCVTASGSFFLKCTYRRIPKPCALLCASDGCFDAFPTPAHFEYYLLGALRVPPEEESLRRAAESMEEFFASGITRDDSSSLAFAAFDFTEEIRLEMRRRQQELLGEMKLDDPAFYSEMDPPEELMKFCETERNQTLLGRREDFWNHSGWIREAVMEELGYSSAEKQESEETAAIRRNREETLRHAVERHWFSVQNKAWHSSPGYLRFNRFMTVAVQAEHDLEQTLSRMNKRQREMAGVITESVSGWRDVQEHVSRAIECCGEIRKELEGRMVEEDQLLIRMYCMLLSGEIEMPNHRSAIHRALTEYSKTVLEGLRGKPGFEQTSLEEVQSLVDELEAIQSIRLEEEADVREALEELAQEIPVWEDDRRAEEQEARSRYMRRPLRWILACLEEHRDSLGDEFAEEMDRMLLPYEDRLRQLNDILTDKKARMLSYMADYTSLLPKEEKECP